jgi:hypothetical protein
MRRSKPNAPHSHAKPTRSKASTSAKNSDCSKNFRTAIVEARTGLLLADGARIEAETRFLKWRPSFVELLGAQDETQRCAQELERARAAIVPFQAAVDRADAAVQNFRRSNRSDEYQTEPAKGKIRIELARLESIRSECLAKRNGLQPEADAALRRWLASDEARARAAFSERFLHPPSPPEPKFSIGELSAVP